MWELYKSIKLMSRTIKIWENMVGKRSREETVVSKNQFRIMLGFFQTMESIFFVWKLIDNHRDKRTNLTMVFIDLEMHMTWP